LQYCKDLQEFTLESLYQRGPHFNFVSRGVINLARIILLLGFIEDDNISHSEVVALWANTVMINKLKCFAAGEFPRWIHLSNQKLLLSLRQIFQEWAVHSNIGRSIETALCVQTHLVGLPDSIGVVPETLGHWLHWYTRPGIE
jgi:hypothetical protein